MGPTLIDTLYKPFYSKDFYVRSAASGWGVGFSALGLVSVLFALAFYALFSGPMNQLFQTGIGSIIYKMPTITIQDGQTSIDKPSPYFVPISIREIVEPFLPDAEIPDMDETVNIAFVMEDLGGLDEIKSWMNQNNVIVLVTRKNVIILEENKRKLEILETEGANDMVITPDTMIFWVDKAKGWIWPMLAIFLVPFLWISWIVQALVVSVAGLVYNAVMKTNLDYGVILRFSSYSLYIACVVDLAFMLTRVNLPGPAFLMIILAAMYFAFHSVNWYATRGKGRP